MKFNSPVRSALALIAMTVLTSCGGGGAKDNPNLSGALQLLPNNAIFYAGVVYTMTVSGGKGPYALTSDNPSLLPVPLQVNGNTFQVVGANPFTLDPGLAANALPVKTVVITAHDVSGGTTTASIQVGRNFLTGYTLDFTSTTCTGVGGAAVTVILPCAGGDTTAELDASISGNLVGDAQYTLEVVSGTMGFVNPLGSNTVTQTYTTTSDHQGRIIAVIRVPAGTPTQIGVIRVTHVASGVSTEYAFTIVGTVAGPLAAIPSTFTFTGPDKNTCGGGAGSFLVTGGTGPYTATSSNPNIAVVATNAAAGRFTLNVSSSAPPCPSGSIIVSDSGTSTPVAVTVTSTVGSATPPVPLSVSPTSTGTIACGSSTSVVATGGSGTYQAASSSGLVTAVVSGNIITITPGSAATVVPPAPEVVSPAATVTVTDGASNVPVSVPACAP